MRIARRTIVGPDLLRMGAAFATTVLTILAQAAANGTVPFT